MHGDVNKTVDEFIKMSQILSINIEWESASD